MQRSFSFDDDESEYRSLPLLPNDSYLPPKPPLHESTPRYSGDYEREPLNITQYIPAKPRYTGYSNDSGHSRHDSSSSSSSFSSISSLTASSVTGVAGLGAPSPRSFQNEDMYSNRQQQPAPGRTSRNPIAAAAGGNIGETSASADPGHEAYPQAEPTGEVEGNWTLTESGGYREEDQGQRQSRAGNGAHYMAPAATGDQYSSSRQYSPTDTLYTPLEQSQAYSSSPMSQTNVPLVPAGSGSLSSRFEDPSPPTPLHAHSRFADPSSPPIPPPTPPHISIPTPPIPPPTPPHTSTSFTQPPPPLHREMGGDPRVLPPPPPHMMDTPNQPTNRVLNNPVGGHYTDNPYSRYSTTWDPQLSESQVEVNGTRKDAETFVFSDDDEQATYSSRGGGYVAAAGTTAAAGGAALGAPAGRGGRTGRSANTPPRTAGATGAGGSALLGNEGGSKLLNEKAPMPSDWLQKQAHSKKKTRWIIGLVLLLIILAAAGGATAGILVNKNKNNTAASSSSSSTNGGSGGGGGGLTVSEDIAQNGDLNKNSKEIVALMKNDKLKKVFHGIDYTPLNSQYPDCVHNPPSQNNITRDVAVMSLLTDKLRLYGTDCNQTEMVLHAITALDVPMKIWLGVWLDSNTTTNSRQLNHLYTLLANYPADRFEGVVVGNEVLFREDLTETQLFGTIQDVRDNLTSLSIDLPVGTSDLGSNWKSTMVSYIDVLMANVHPFFAGVTAAKAANWTSTFFEENDVILTNGLAKKPRVMISEVGWPSSGGRNTGSVAGINEMNTFMEDFLCTENKKKTEYFWFSAFDEPWKVKFNEPGKEWEDKWGLMDVDRKLKDGLVIPDCLAKK